MRRLGFSIYPENATLEEKKKEMLTQILDNLDSVAQREAV